MKRIIILLTLVITAGAGALDLQFMRDKNLNAGLYFKNAWVGESRVMLLALPTVYSFAATDELAFDAVTTPAFANSNLDESAIFRFAGTKVRASYIFRELLIGTLGFKVPTGINQFSLPQLSTAGNVATRQLAFRNADLFSTVDVSAGLSSCVAFRDVGPGDLSVGLGLSCLFKGAFTPAEEPDMSFNPGDEFNLSTAAEYVFLAADRRITAMLDIGFTVYGNDKPEEGPEIEAGSKVNWAFNAAAELVENVPASVRLANYRKGANAIKDFAETQKDARDLILSLKGGIPALLDYRPYGVMTFGFYEGGGANGFGDAFIFTLGAGASTRLSERMFASAELGLDMGGLEEEGVFGIELSGGLQYKF